MSRTLVIGDVHGALKALKEILEKAEVKPEDQVIFLGDYVDGWSDSAKTIDFLIDLKERQNCIILKGNHDDLILNWLKTGNTNPKWLQHGGKNTIEAYDSINKTHRRIHADFIENLPHYHVDRKQIFMALIMNFIKIQCIGTELYGKWHLPQIPN
jgi:serine/threonine protein phosphatase 1